MTISKESMQAVGEAIDNASNELPMHYEVSILIELGGFRCKLMCPDGEVETFNYNYVDDSIIEAVARANEIERNKYEAG